MVLGIDIDNTIVNTHFYTQKYMAKYHPEVKSHDYHDLKNEIRPFLNKYFLSITSDLEVIDNVIPVFNEFKNRGYKLYLITARGSENIDPSLNIEEATTNKINELGIPYDKISFNNKTKVMACKKLDVDIFIDDKLDNIKDVSSAGIKCIRFLEKGEKKSKYPEFDNWMDILKYIEMGEYL